MRTRLLVLSAVWLAAASPAAAQSRPANDDFSAAQDLAGLPVSASGSNAGATAETGEPAPEGTTPDASVWYRWTAPVTGNVTIDTCASDDFDTILAVYTGTALGALTEIASSDDECGLQSRVTFRAFAGQEYRIAVDGFEAARGSFTLRLSGPPANDDFAAAAPLTGFPARTSGSNVNASTEVGEPNRSGEGGPSVWYRWSAPAGGPVTAQTCGARFDTLLTVHSGSALGALTRVAANDDGCGLASRLTFRAVAGREYRIRVDGFEQAVGDFELLVRRGRPPSNDALASAELLRGSAPRARGSNREASTEAGEPSHGRPRGGASVWYRWRAPASGRTTVDTCRTGFDTLLAVYGRTGVRSLRRIRRDDDGCGTASRLSFVARRGRVYRIAVDGFRGHQGSFRLRLRQR